MAKQIFTTEKESYEINLTSDKTGYQIEFGGETLQLDLEVVEAGSGVLHLKHQAIPFYCAKVGEKLYLWIEGKNYELTKQSTGAKRGSGGAAGVASGEIKAPMPGTVLKIKVAVGDMVNENQPLVIMESMKMEMTLSAPCEAKVLEVKATEGQLVDMGSLLVKLEPIKTE